MVVYGENGAGKSCFVDAIEYVLNGGRIGHLAHEYSGKRQEKGIINTHTPEWKKTELRIKFKDGSELTTEIKRNGTSTSSGAEHVAISSWAYRRTVLRQDEVAAFISDTKGGKYSALLPLLGLGQMEVAAENIRQLAKSVQAVSKLDETRIKLRAVRTKQRETFGADDYDQILKRIEKLHKTYCPDKTATTDPLARSDELETAIETRVSESTADQRRYTTLQDAAGLKLKDHVYAVRSASAKLARAVEPLIAEKLEVLQSAGVFVDKLGDEKEVMCPACGRSIPVEEFQAHVRAEKERLEEAIASFETRKAAIETLCDTLKSLKRNLGKADVKSWRDDLVQESLSENFTYLDGFKTEAFHVSATEDDLGNIEDKLLPLIDAAATASKGAPPDAKQLSTDRQIVETAKAVIDAKELAAAAKRAEALISFVNALERGTREEIRLGSQKVIDEITEDIQGMWAILHPGEPIENVRLCVPPDTDKAIDIGLKFHGKEQDSPRLTLSEGFRNSLGLCIFLAMAKREASEDRPIFLDDVVVSLDRNHRGMISALLEKEFGDRQVIVLTHDREWYTELRQQLDQKNWSFKALMPYEKPGIGIRWSAKTWTFNDARALLKDAPDSAGNTARKIMDIELAVRAERLQLRLPYLRGEKNDHRTAHDFLSQIISDGKKCYQKKSDKGHEPNEEALAMLREADNLLLSWGNKASHTFDIVRPEAGKLIEACERALETFDCPCCKKPVFKLDGGNAEFVQCECGHLRWRYGKA
jgi:DNA repair exonuclease SbcCD ATPase subunit